jgi:hypothetical protein
MRAPPIGALLGAVVLGPGGRLAMRGVVFTAAFPFEQPVALPHLDPRSLRDFCVTEYGEDAEEMATAIQSADAFFRAALERASREHLVVFLIT